MMLQSDIRWEIKDVFEKHFREEFRATEPPVNWSKFYETYYTVVDPLVERAVDEYLKEVTK